jgi:hypothetical protein
MFAHPTAPASLTPPADPLALPDPTACPNLAARPEVLTSELLPNPEGRPFEPDAFLLRLCPPGDGLKARWSGRRWVQGPDGSEVLVRVVLLEMLSGAFYFGVVRLESGAVPVILRLDAVASHRPTFTIT